MKVSLAHLEARLQALIEGSAARLFPFGGSRPDSFGQDLAFRLVSAMQSNLRPRSGGTYWAPNLFDLLVHPSQAQVLSENRDWIEGLAQELQRLGSQEKINFPSPPVIQVISDPEVGLREIRIQASFTIEHLAQTSSLEGKAEPVEYAPPSGGYLIVGGSQLYPLKSAVVNIGRSTRNDLVIDDIRVSREHAQLRAIQGRYVIFDLDSTGGTFINGQRAIQGVLFPGDTISLAGVTLIFSQDTPSTGSETQPYPPEQGEDPH
jgi:hypothetical protein